MGSPRSKKTKTFQFQGLEPRAGVQTGNNVHFRDSKSIYILEQKGLLRRALEKQVVKMIFNIETLMSI